MTTERDIGAEARRIDAVYRKKAAAEISAADSLVGASLTVHGRGDVLADVLLVKGAPGQADVASGKTLAGEDGVAIGKALDALDVPKARYAFCSRVGAGATDDGVSRVRMLVEAIDPLTVVLLDAEAASDFAQAYGTKPIGVGVAHRIAGRTVVATDGFEESLGDEQRKRLVWNQLQALRRETGAP